MLLTALCYDWYTIHFEFHPKKIKKKKIILNKINFKQQTYIDTYIRWQILSINTAYVFCMINILLKSICIDYHLGCIVYSIVITYISECWILLRFHKIGRYKLSLMQRLTQYSIYFKIVYICVVEENGETLWVMVTWSHRKCVVVKQNT